VPDEDADQQKPEGQAAIVATPAAPAATSGISGLIGRIWGFLQERSALRTQLVETQTLYEANRRYSQAVRTAVQAIMKQGDDIRAAGQPVTPEKQAAAPPVSASAPPPPTASAQTAESMPGYDELLLQMKQYSAVAVAISRVNMTLRTCTNDLNDWIDLLSQHIRDLFRMLAWRVVVLALLILGIIGLSMVAQRATKRYVLDDRRQTQLRTVRRGISGIAIAITVFIAFFTDFGSLATFAGLFTAGMAVALQTPILSVISYFNFFGPFGIRLGDRLTVASVTGKVIQITPLRFSMMELRDSDLGYLPSGRVVGFANSVLFQPAPFFRQTNSTNFVWSEVSLTLDPSIDYEEAFKKLSAVVQKVYARHSDVIKKQEAAFQSLTRFKAEVSVPQMYLKITGNGIVMVIRYAVQREHEREVNLEMTSELLSAIKRDPKLKFVNIS
jgi:small-conductance mechanosensitive channel